VRVSLTFDSAEDYNGTLDILYTATDRGDPDNCGTPGPACDRPQTSTQKKVTVTVNAVNFAPSVTLTGGPSSSVNEGNATYTFNFSVTDDPEDTFTVSDPGDDTYEVEQNFPTCGQNGTLVANSLATNATGGSFECVFPDGDTTSNVAIKVKDSDGDADIDNQLVTVTVENRPPTATFNAPDSINEGEDMELSLTGATDPAGDNDTLEYRFDCGSGFGAYGADSTTTCPTTDDGSVVVRGQVKDEDGGESEGWLHGYDLHGEPARLAWAEESYIRRRRHLHCDGYGCRSGRLRSTLGLDYLHAHGEQPATDG
jgi:hypothetical protein